MRSLETERSAEQRADLHLAHNLALALILILLLTRAFASVALRLLRCTLLDLLHFLLREDEEVVGCLGGAGGEPQRALRGRHRGDALTVPHQPLLRVTLRRLGRRLGLQH